MLNPSYPETLSRAEERAYILPREVAKVAFDENRASDTGHEMRIQKVYGDELWLKLKSLGFKNFNWGNKEVLDISCGTGFLSFHLLSRIIVKKLTLLDISESEVEQAKKILAPFSKKVSLDYIIIDGTNTGFPDASFDVIIGNSFLHHFPNLPAALNEFRRLLRPGGVFVTLHEPTIAAVALESRNPFTWFLYILRGSEYINILRRKNKGRHGCGGDVWIFKKNEIVELFHKAGFKEIRTENWHFLRPLIVTVLNLHLGPQKRKLNLIRRIVLRIAIYTDTVLRKILPQTFFASVALLAKKIET